MEIKDLINDTLRSAKYRKKYYEGHLASILSYYDESNEYAIEYKKQIDMLSEVIDFLTEFKEKKEL
jgi:hypothetical protein